MTQDDLITEAQPTAYHLSRAVDTQDADTIHQLLTPLNREQLYALTIVLAAHVDIPIIEQRRRPRTDIDEILVERVLNGDWDLAKDTTQAERILICHTWVKRGNPISRLEKHTCWKPERYYKTPHQDAA